MKTGRPRKRIVETVLLQDRDVNVREPLRHNLLRRLKLA